MKDLSAALPANPWKPVRVLSIAGSDSGGGAGIQADIKTVSALGGYCATAITAVTVQNTQGVAEVMPVPAETVCAQVEAVCQDIAPQAVKISMLPDAHVAEPLSEILRRHACRNLVIDPVMVATSGQALSRPESIREIVSHLFPLASIVTPNLEEAAALAGMGIESEASYLQAADRILKDGPAAVLIKGGHAKGKGMNDLLATRAEPGFPAWFTAQRISSRNLHGTGCTLSAAIAFFLASGFETVQAVALAKDYLFNAIKAGKSMVIGHGPGPVNHFFQPVPCRRPRKKRDRTR